MSIKKQPWGEDFNSLFRQMKITKFIFSVLTIPLIPFCVIMGNGMSPEEGRIPFWEGCKKAWAQWFED